MVDVGKSDVSRPFEPQANLTAVQPLFSSPFSGIDPATDNEVLRVARQQNRTETMMCIQLFSRFRLKHFKIEPMTISISHAFVSPPPAQKDFNEAAVGLVAFSQ